MKDLAAIGTLISKSTFAALGSMFPLLLMVYACLLKAAGFDGPFKLIELLNRSKLLDGILIMFLFICLLILTSDIFVSLHFKNQSTVTPKITEQKAILDLVLIIITIGFSIFIYLFHAFDMLGNIPVGRG